MNNRKSELLQAHYDKYKQIIRGLTMMSDAFMRNVLKKKECAEYVIQVIMGQRDLKIDSVVIQQDHKNLQGRSALLDCVALAADGRKFDVEVQQETDDASPKRARYYSGILDANTLNPGEAFDELPRSHVIFITEEDVLGHGLAIYHMSRVIEETRTFFEDQSHIIYVNSQICDDTELGRLMHDFHCADADDMYSPVLADRVRELKETQEGVEDMCREMEKIYNEGRVEGEEKGRREGQIAEKKATARSLADMGMPMEKIAQAVRVSLDLVKQWV